MQWWGWGRWGVHRLSRTAEIELFRLPFAPAKSSSSCGAPAGLDLLWLRMHRRVLMRAPYLALSNPDGPTADCLLPVCAAELAGISGDLARVGGSLRTALAHCSIVFPSRIKVC